MCRDKGTTFFFSLQQTAVPHLYEDEGTDQYDNIYDVKGADMNYDPDDLEPYELERLIEYLKERGPRAYDENYYWFENNWQLNY